MPQKQSIYEGDCVVRVVFKHYKHEKYSYTAIPRAKISQKPTEDIIEFEYGEGKDYTIVVSRKNIYETPFCYFNIINPFLYLWRFKVPSNPKAEAERVLQTRIIRFSAEKTDGRLELALGNGDDEARISCTDSEAVSRVRVGTNSVSPKVKQRYAVTNISNTLLFMIATIVLLLLLGNEWRTIGVVALIDVGVSVNTIFTIIKQLKTGTKQSD